MNSDEAVAGDRGLTARPHADGRDAAAGELLDAQHVVLSGPGQVVEVPHPRDVLAPAWQLLVDGDGVVEVGLGQGHVLHPPAVDLVGHAHGDRLMP